MMLSEKLYVNKKILRQKTGSNNRTNRDIDASFGKNSICKIS